MIYLLSASLAFFLAWPACHLLLRYTNRYALNRWLLLIASGLVTLLPLLPVQSPAPEATVALQGTIDYVIADIAATTIGIKFFLYEKEVDPQEFYRKAALPNQLLTLARRMGRDETFFVIRLDRASVIGQ